MLLLFIYPCIYFSRLCFFLRCAACWPLCARTHRLARACALECWPRHATALPPRRLSHRDFSRLSLPRLPRLRGTAHGSPRPPCGATCRPWQRLLGGGSAILSLLCTLSQGPRVPGSRCVSHPRVPELLGAVYVAVLFRGLPRPSVRCPVCSRCGSPQKCNTDYSGYSRR